MTHDIVLISEVFAEEGFQLHGLFSSLEDALDHILKDTGSCPGLSQLSDLTGTALTEDYFEIEIDSIRWVASRQPLRSPKIREAFAAGALAMQKAAIDICHEVETGAKGTGYAFRKARPSPGVNPHSHRSGEIQLGAARCSTAISRITIPDLPTKDPAP